jgi:hypothetical protein
VRPPPLPQVSTDLAARDALSGRLKDLAAATKATSRELSKFHFRVVGVVDDVIALDEFTLRRLQELDAAQKNAISPGGIAKFIPRALRTPYDYAATRREVYATFVEVSSATERAIRSLLNGTEVPLQMLDELEQKLLVITEAVQRENLVVGSVEPQQMETNVFAMLWAPLLRHDSVDSEEGERLLADIGTYKENAIEIVGQAMVLLEDVENRLKNLRSRLAEPTLVADTRTKAKKLPLEAHIQSIRDSMGKLSGAVSRATYRDIR